MDIEIFINILEATIICLVLGGLIVWVYWGCKNKRNRSYAIAPIMFLSHYLLFIVLSVFHLLSKDVYVVWRNLVMIHGLLVLVFAGYVMIQMTTEEDMR